MKIKRKELNEIYDLLGDVIFAKKAENVGSNPDSPYLIPNYCEAERNLFRALGLLEGAGVTGTEEN